MIKKLTSIILVAIMVLSLAGCATNEGTENILTAGENELGAGVYIGYMIDAYTNAGYYVYEDNIWDGVIEDKSVEDYVRDTAIDSVKRHIAVEMMFDEMGLTLSEEDTLLIEKDAAAFVEYTGDFYIKNGCGVESLERIISIEYKISEIFMSLYYEDGSEAVSDDEKTEYYENNYAEYRVMRFSYYDASYALIDDEGKEEVNAIAESYLERAKGDEDFDELAVEAVEELAAHYGTESFTAYDTENSYKIIKPDDTANEEEFVKAIFDSEELVSEIYYGETAVLVFQRNALDRDPELRDNLEVDIIASLRSEEFETKLDEYEESLGIELNQASVDRYSPRNIDPNV